ncbi:hypothetical protein [Brachybacterium sp. UMB0905]|uniref:hypothetical protein n=1 Tax=Brachybacterium sp. UMB0905 TaxID=2069310 RepID=UPI000C804836|nr:hypothetical protein [Brachybacterium sp. UMB0905]PMC75664.1 hypothetical protein CJ197_08000 [Brachybacterium sp. UMB0905]
MTISYDAVTGTVRATAEETAEALALLIADGPLPAGLPAGDEALDAMRTALRSPLLSVILTNSGPGGHHEHHVTCGLNAVTVRRSVAREDLSEIVPAPFLTLPGMLTRLLRFQPCEAPLEGAATIAVDAEQITALESDDAAARTAAWSQLHAQLGADEKASWQLVRMQTAWTSTDGSPAEDFAVYLRVEESCWVLLHDDEAFELVPVPSITAWEAIMHTLPGANEVKDPRS